MYKSLLNKQFQIDFSCEANQLEDNLFVTANSSPDSRYWARGKADIVCYQNKLLVRTEQQGLTEELKNIYSHGNPAWFLEMENLNQLSELLKKYQLKFERIAPFFIPSQLIPVEKANTAFRFFEQGEIKQFQDNKEITEAFCYSDVDPDQLGLGYYVDNQLVAICGANKNGKYTWEIGIEILDETYKGQGIATKLVKTLLAKIQAEQPTIIPVYSTAFSHVSSINVAINAGCKLGWTEIIISDL